MCEIDLTNGDVLNSPQIVNFLQTTTRKIITQDNQIDIPGLGLVVFKYSLLNFDGQFELFNLNAIYAAGGQGKLYESLGILYGDRHQLYLRKDRSSVIKIQHSTNLSDVERQLYQNQHPLVCRPLIEESGLSYLVMKKAPGVSLDKILNNEIQQLPIPKRFELVLELIDAVIHQVHNYGIVHMDLKPENIIYHLKCNRVTIIDFGISMFCHQTYSAEGEDKDLFTGSYSYAPPEMYERDVDAEYSPKLESDIYSLALIIAEILGAEKKPRAKGFAIIPQAIKYSNKMNYKHTLPLVGLTIKCRDDIEQLLTHMSISNPNYRPNLNHVRERFHEIMIDFDANKENACSFATCDHSHPSSGGWFSRACERNSATNFDADGHASPFGKALNFN